MTLRSLLMLSVAVASISVAGAGTIDHDKVQPFAQPEPVTISEKTSVKFKPSLQIVTGCHPYPAVNAAGETSGGLKGTGGKDEGCTGSELGSQVYGRATWYGDLWAIMYAWYFPKERGFNTVKKGQRHKWVSAIVWLDNAAVEKPKVLAISTWSAVDYYDILKEGPPKCRHYRRGPPSCARPYVEYINGTTVMILYDRYFDGTIGDFQMLRPTTIMGTGEFQDLIMWEQLTEEARTALSNTDFGEKSPVPFIDANFNKTLDMARPIF